ncbi:hypothetical protein POTOM_000426 [Populus tomentosa]|uniref:4-methyl-5-beta-hydroxyethylthiazole kinase n=1 Tax=Populus tomentosa TaxID=118781 RepID=A0A8X8AQ46_POPTO|nr:hypothetical protein POTOM_000426 [Populus tomentosa]
MDAMEAAKTLAQSSGSIIAVSGAVDIISYGHQVVGAHNGVPMMQKITATGCAVTALICECTLSIPCIILIKLPFFGDIQMLKK